MTLDAHWSAVARGYRNSVFLAAVLGVVAIAASVVAGDLLAGIFTCIGLGLGCWNARKLWSETTSLKGEFTDARKAMAFTGLKRLGLITLIAFLVAIAYRADGWTVFVGLVAFQLMMMALLIRPLRRVVATTF